jgi:hypothetical protein
MSAHLMTRPVRVATASGCGWFRLFGYGLAWVDRRRHPPLLSERYAGRHGFRARRVLSVGSWRVTVTTWRNP